MHVSDPTQNIVVLNVRNEFVLSARFFPKTNLGITRKSIWSEYVQNVSSINLLTKTNLGITRKSIWSEYVQNVSSINLLTKTKKDLK